MVEALVITLREGLEAALVIGIILAYLSRTGKANLYTYVYKGLGLAIAASLAGAVIFNMVGFDPENEIWEGSMYLVAGIFVGTMVIWMWRTAKNMRHEMETRLEQITVSDEGNKKQGFGILLFTFFMVFREGVETVLFMAALSGNSSPVASLSGALVGLALAVLFAVFFIRGSLQINLQRFFKVTGLILLVLVTRLFAGSLHEFSEIQLIPMNPAVMKVLGYIVKDSGSQIISMMMLTLPILMVLLDVKETNIVPVNQITDSIERRKALAAVKRNRTWKFSVVTSAVVINLILGANLVSAMTRQVYDPNPIPLEIKNNAVIVNTADLKESILTKYSVNVDGTKVRLLVIKRKDGTIGTGLDACQICGPAGYFQEEGNSENITCKNCNAPITISTIGMPGGCNPVALKSDIKDGKLTIKASDLTEKVKVFNK